MACYSSWHRAWPESAGGALLLSLSSSPGTSGWAAASEVTHGPLNLSAKSWHPSSAASYPSRCKASQIQGGGDRPHSRLEERRRICSCGGFVAGFYPAQPLVRGNADSHTEGVDTGGGGDERDHKGGCSPRSGDPCAFPAVTYLTLPAKPRTPSTSDATDSPLQTEKLSLKTWRVSAQLSGDSGPACRSQSLSALQEPIPGAVFCGAVAHLGGPLASVTPLALPVCDHQPRPLPRGPGVDPPGTNPPGSVDRHSRSQWGQRDHV